MMPNLDPYLLFYKAYDSLTSSPYLRIGIVVICVFLLIFVLGSTRKHFFKLSMRGAVFGFLIGVFLMLVLDLVIILGISDKSKLGKLFSKETGQQAVGEVFVSGVTNLSNVLGVSTVITSKKPRSASEIVNDALNLPEGEAKKVKLLLCP